MSDQNNDSSKQSFLEKLLDYVAKNPFLTLWNIAIIIGGLVGYIHYSRITYVPEIDVKSVATIFIALALTGTFFAIALAVIFLTPALYLRMILWGDQKKSAPITSADSTSDIVNNDLILRRCNVSALALRTAILALGLWGLLIWILSDQPWESPEIWIGLIGLVLILVTTVFAKYIGKLFQISDNERKRKSPTALQNLFSKYTKFIQATLVWIFAFGFIAILIWLMIFNNKSLSDWSKAFWIISFIGIVVVSNVVLTTANRQIGNHSALLAFSVFAIAPIAYFLIIPNNPFSVEKGAFRGLGLGSVENSFFLVTPEACMAINVIRENSCIPIISKGDVKGAPESNTKNIGCIRPRFLENRLGPEFLLAYEEKIPDKSNSKNRKTTEIFIPLKKTDVLVWAFGQTAMAGSSQCEKLEPKAQLEKQSTNPAK